MSRSVYEKDFLDAAIKFETVTKEYESITNLAQTIVETNDEVATKYLLNKISQQVGRVELTKEVRCAAIALKDSLIKYLGYIYVLNICSRESFDKDERSLLDLWSDLNGLIGLDAVKSQVQDLISYQKVQKKRESFGLVSSKSTLHIAFTGGPGTGKTTVARIVGRIYKQIGLLSRGHFVEVSRTDLIAGYQGQTALKVKRVMEKAKGGVLFIDEAYSITENDHSDSYGRECLTELTKALEDYRHDLVVIVAGYTEPMIKFFESNPGLKSRFNNFIEFKDYTVDEMLGILNAMCFQSDYQICDDAIKIIHKFIVAEKQSINKRFSNGRLARNIYDKLIMQHAKRVVGLKDSNRSLLSKITVEDCSIF